MSGDLITRFNVLARFSGFSKELNGGRSKYHQEDFRTNKREARQMQKGMETQVGDHARTCFWRHTGNTARRKTDAKRQTKSGGFGKGTNR
jgi:hypothetical protein